LKRELDSSAAGRPESLGQAVYQMPESAVIGRIAQTAQALDIPVLVVSIEGNVPIWQPGDVTGERFALNRSHADAVQQFASDATRFKINQSGRANIEGEAFAPEEASASARLSMRLENDSADASGLQACRRCHSGDARADDCYLLHRCCPIV
jgi:hypothetical protein